MQLAARLAEINGILVERLDVDHAMDGEVMLAWGMNGCGFRAAECRRIAPVP